MKRKLVVTNAIALVALLALALTPVTAPAGAQTDAPRRPRLRAVNVIRGSGGSYAEVRVRRPARTSAIIRPRREKGPSSDIDISRVNPATAIVLVPDPVPASIESSDRVFIAGEFERCFSPDCASDKRTSYMFPGTYPGTGGAKWLDIPAGNYRLYLVTEGRTKVTLRLDGLRGKARIFPGSPAPLELKTPQESLFYDQSGSVFAAGDTYAEQLQGIIVTTLFARADVEETDFNFGICSYDQANPPPPEFAYGPNCSQAGADGAGMHGSWFGIRAFELIMMIPYSNEEEGERGFGGWISTADTIEVGGSHAFFLGLE